MNKQIFLSDHPIRYDQCLSNKQIFLSDHPIRYDQCLSNKQIFLSDHPIRYDQCLSNKQVFLPDHPIRYDQCLSNMVNVFGQQTGQDGYGSEHNSTYPRRISTLACSFLNGLLGHVTTQDRCCERFGSPLQKNAVANDSVVHCRRTLLRTVWRSSAEERCSDGSAVAHC